MSDLHLHQVTHPSKEAATRYEGLIGIDAIKEAMVDELTMILDRTRLNAWAKAHHPNGLALLNDIAAKAPLIILSGEVGCGKTVLASCVATPVAKAIDQRVLCLETPSDIRGGGHVGEVSLRITEAFTQAKTKAASVGRAILIIDEADDLATRRSQMQAHHEDRAGVNVLIKQISQLEKEKTPIAVIMITNRHDVLDPAIVRRAALTLRFDRPNDEARAAVFKHLLQGTSATATDIAELVKLTKRPIPYTYSDLTTRLAGFALRRSWKRNIAFGHEALKMAIAEIEPSPLIEINQKI